LGALDVINFLMPDVQTGVGPFLAVYLAASRRWSPGAIGVALAAGGIAGLIAQTPMGAFVDRLRQKREALAVATGLLAIGALAVIYFQSFPEIIGAQVLMGIVGTFFPPAMAGMTLGIVGRTGLDGRIGRNETFNHAGNVFGSVAAGLLGSALVRESIFYFAAMSCVITIVAIFFIRAREIDFARARGYDKGETANVQNASGFREILGNRSLLIFILSVVLFHLANAAMLPLVGQELSLGHPHAASLCMAVCITGAQLVMVPVALMAGRVAPESGRRVVFLIGFAALPIRGILYTLSGNPLYLISVQLLDGIGAGIFGVMSILIISDLTRATGRFNLVQGMVATAIGLGASLSNSVAGFIAQHAGYNAAFLMLSATAAMALAVFAVAMPETKTGRIPPSATLQHPADYQRRGRARSRFKCQTANAAGRVLRPHADAYTIHFL
jgi:predicted MFS family arabinose efflux permease